MAGLGQLLPKSGRGRALDSLTDFFRHVLEVHVVRHVKFEFQLVESLVAKRSKYLLRFLEDIEDTLDTERLSCQLSEERSQLDGVKNFLLQFVVLLNNLL